MPDRYRRTLLHHLLALDLVVVALGITYLVPDSLVAMYGAFLLVVVASAWKGGEEAGLAATGYSVAAMVIFFPTAVTPGTLMGFAGTGALISTFVRVARRVRAREEGVATPIAMPDLTTVPFAIGLPALAVVMYTDLSDLLMENFPVPSMLQPLILLLAVAAWRARKIVHPFAAMLHPVAILLALYALAVFSTTIFAKDVRLADHRFQEVVKAAIITIVAASLAATWSSLRRALTVLVIAAASLASISVVQIVTGRFYGIFGGLLEPETGTIWGELALPRAAGPPVSDPNAYARILLITIPVAVALAIANRNHPKLRLVFTIAAMVTTAGTLVTYSRGAMLALAAMAVMLFIAMRGNMRQLAAAAVALVLALLLLPENITRRFITVESLLPGSEESVKPDNALEKRKLLVNAGLAMFDENPLAGVGAGNYSKHFVNFANVTGSSFMDYHRPGSVEHAHGLYFEAAAETGLLGLLTLTAALIAAVLTSWRTARELLRRGLESHAAIAAGLGVAVASYMVASVVLHESHLRYIGMFFGFVIAAARLTRSHAPDEALA
jgi:O-antigen ligase